MIKPVFVPEVYIEEEGRRIKVENIINMNLEEIEILYSIDSESCRILDNRVYEIKPFEVFIVFGHKEYSMLGSADVMQHYGFGPSLEEMLCIPYDKEEVVPSFSPAFEPLHMYIHLAPKESELDGNNES